MCTADTGARRWKSGSSAAPRSPTPPPSSGPRRSSPRIAVRSSSSRRRSAASPICCSTARTPRPPARRAKPRGPRRTSCAAIATSRAALLPARAGDGALLAHASTRRRASIASCAARSPCSATSRRGRATCWSRAANACRPPSLAAALAAIGPAGGSTSTRPTSCHRRAARRRGAGPRRDTRLARAARCDPLLARADHAGRARLHRPAPDGSVTTLGRGGSDLTATLLARALGARRVVLWKDVPGILTADPRLVPDARLIPQLHHREAAEVAHYGAKVLHPRALIPIAGTRIVLHVRSFLDPEQPGHRGVGAPLADRRIRSRRSRSCAARRSSPSPARAWSASTASPRARSPRSTPSACRSRRSSRRRRRARSGSRCRRPRPRAASRAVRHAFRDELSSRARSTTSPRAPGMAVVAVVGDGMAGRARHRGARLHRARPPAASTSSRSRRDRRSATSRLWSPTTTPPRRRAAFTPRFSSRRSAAAARRRRRAPTSCLLGFGRVGRALADQIAAPNGGAAVRVVGCSIARATCSTPRGFRGAGCSRSRGRRIAGALLASLGGRPASAAEALTLMARHAVSRPVIVDVTSEETGDLLRAALGHGFDLVLANKKPLAGSWDELRALLDATTARRAGASATRRPSAPGCRSSTRSTSSSRPAIACCASRAASAAR